MADRTPPPDQAERNRVAEQLDQTLFVEAGAGSGKTTALVGRILNLVLQGVELRTVAAITFTEKAGAELRDRLRRRLEEATIDPCTDEPATSRCRDALDQLDGAAIGTLHAFAQRILSEHPIEAGLPPRVEVLDEVSSGVEFERRWGRFQDQLLADPACERTILLLLATGARTEAFRAIAQTFDQNWDLVLEQLPEHSPEPPQVSELLAPVVEEIHALCSLRAQCQEGADRLVQRLDEIAQFVDDLGISGPERQGQVEAELELPASVDPVVLLGSELDLLDRLGSAPSFRVGNLGQKGCWDCDVKEVRSRVAAVGEQLTDVKGLVAQACAHSIGSAIRHFTLAAAAERQAAGELEFHDLLVLARSLLRHPEHGAEVRTALHQHYQRLLLDEFQDTDPIQIELAVRIAAAEPASPAAGTAPWPEVVVGPGRLFVVGDPKQSIYRFRRADVALFIEARERFGPAGGGAVRLTANFRTGEQIIGWVNDTFATLMAEPSAEQLPLTTQPEYIALDAVRPTPPVGPPVAVLGRDAHPQAARASDVRTAESVEVAATIARILAEGWSVTDGTDDQGVEQWRPAAPGDITILVPARTSLPYLDDALTKAGIAYRAESSSIVYGTRAVRDLLMVARAIDDPTDSLRLVAALRTPLFGCGDDDLARFKLDEGGRFGLGGQPDSVSSDGPVARALAYLSALSTQKRWLAPSELLDTISRDRRAFELGFAERRPRDVWRRHRFVIDQARAWHEATGGNLRQYLVWVTLQTAEGARVAESILPETDDDSVRIMTIHAAKGLEFPITIVSGMSSIPGGRTAAAQVRFPPDGGVAYRIGPGIMTTEFADGIPLDEQMSLDERIRLLYVATTRAKDHLVVSLHRSQRAKAPTSTNRTNAELLVDGIGEEPLAVLPSAAPDDPTLVAAPTSVRPAAPMPWDQWEAELSQALAAGRRPSTVAATALTDEGHADTGEPDPGLQKRPRDLDLPPWLKGRYGTSVGRAVHGVLQTIDLATGTGLEAAVAAQCEAEAIPERMVAVGELVSHALGSDVVREAAAAPHWREVYACTPLAGGRMLEGYVDLLYRTLGGLVVVDYKTAGTNDPGVLDQRVAGYRLQGASYAVAVGAATAEPVHRVVFLFLTPGGAVARELTDLDGATAEVHRLVAAGQELEGAE